MSKTVRNYGCLFYIKCVLFEPTTSIKNFSAKQITFAMDTRRNSFTCYCKVFLIQCVPLATEPGISLILLFLMGVSEREGLLPLSDIPIGRAQWPKSLARTFPKYGAPGSIMSGRKWWPLPAHVMMSSHFLHNEISPLQISLQYSH